MRRWLLSALVASACGPDTADQPELRELCGSAGPVQVLPFADGDTSFGFATPMRLSDGRVLWAVRSLQHTADEPLLYSENPSSAWITGPCGESPERIEGVDRVSISPLSPGVLIGRVGDALARDQIVIDASALERRSPLFTGIGLDTLGETRHGVVSIDGNDAGLRQVAFRRYPGDPWAGPVAPVALAELSGAFVGTDTFATLMRVTVHDDAAWIVTSDDQLVRVSLPDGLSTVEQEDVRAFTVSADERWLIWQDLAIAEGSSPSYPTGRISLRDRSDATDVPLWNGGINTGSLHGVDDGVLRSPEGWVALDDLAPIPVRDDRLLTGPREGRWISEHHRAPAYLSEEPLGLSLFDLDSGREQLLYDQPGQIAGARPEGLGVAHGLSLATYPAPLSEAPLWLVPFDGSAPRELAHAITSRFLWLGDGRIVTPRHVDADHVGELVWIDPGTLDEKPIDDDVSAMWGVHEAEPQLWGDAVVLYPVHDGARSGMWIARLPPA